MPVLPVKKFDDRPALDLNIRGEICSLVKIMSRTMVKVFGRQNRHATIYFSLNSHQKKIKLSQGGKNLLLKHNQTPTYLGQEM